MYEHSFASHDTSVLYVHWYFADRSELKLNIVEKFHFLMMERYKLNNFFDKFVFVVAINDNNELTQNFIKEKIFSHFDRPKVNIHFICNDEKLKEKLTFKMMIDDLFNNSQDIDYYYIHFKGVSRLGGNDILDILFWVYLCYFGLFRNVVRGKHLEDQAICSYIHRNPSSLSSKWHYSCQDKRIMFPDYHNSGSFQAYKAKLFRKCAENLGLKREDIDNIIDAGSEYVVEWLLTSIIPIEMIDPLTFSPTYEYPSYELFSTGKFPEHRSNFIKCYREAKRA